MPSNLLEAALDYARRGWPVFPLAPMGKRPIVPNGFHKATTDLDEITTWWTRWPNANIGIPAGEGTFCVVDIDPYHGGEDSLNALREEFGPVPETLRQITGTGGTHFCFLPDARVGNTEGARNGIAQGIDTRGNGRGYIVVAPSIHKNGNAYAWDNPGVPLAAIPDWLIPQEKTLPPIPEPASSLPTGVPWLDDSNGVEARARAYLRQCDPAVQGSGGHAALLWACTAMVWGYELDDETAYHLLAEEYNPRCSPPWSLSSPAEYREFRRKITEGRKEKHNPRGWLLAEWNREQEILANHGRQMAQALIANAAGQPRSAPPAVPAVAAEPTLKTVDQDLLHPPGLTGDLCAYINRCAMKKQPLLTLGNVFALGGALLGRKVRDDWNARTNVLCLGIGESSCGKEHSRSCIKELCQAAGIADQILGGEEVTSDAAIAAVLRERPSCLFQWDEIGHMIASMKDKYGSSHRKTIVPMLMKMYSSAKNIYLGKEYSSGDRQDIIQPNLCLYGTTVPDTLWKGLSVDELRDGFLGRMLMFISRDDDPDVDDENSRIADPPRHLLEKIAAHWQYKPEPPPGTPDIQRYTDTWQVTVPTDPEAQATFRTFRDVTVRTIKREAKSRNDPVFYLWGRAYENARKIALIIASLDAMTLESAIITPYHADYACRLVHMLMNDFSAAVGDNIADSQVELVIRRILKWVKDAGEAGLPREIVTNRLRNPRERKEALDDLLREGEIFEAIVDRKRVLFAPPHGLQHLRAKQGKA